MNEYTCIYANVVLDNATLRVGCIKPYTRQPIPPVKRFRDKKKDYRRKEKHQEKPIDEVSQP